MSNKRSAAKSKQQTTEASTPAPELTPAEWADLAGQVEVACTAWLVPLAKAMPAKQTGLSQARLMRFLQIATVQLRQIANDAAQTELLEAELFKPKHTPAEAAYWAEFEAQKAR